jgi:hypothetical protein
VGNSKIFQKYRISLFLVNSRSSLHPLILVFAPLKISQDSHSLIQTNVITSLSILQKIGKTGLYQRKPMSLLYVIIDPAKNWQNGFVPNDPSL